MKQNIIVFYDEKVLISFSHAKYLSQLISTLLLEIFPQMKTALNQHRLDQYVYASIVEKFSVYYLDFYEKYHQVNEPK
jgi:hypothetical protein